MNYFNLLESKLETSDKIINKYITINFHWNQSHRINIGKDINTSMSRKTNSKQNNAEGIMSASQVVNFWLNYGTL